MSYFFETEQYIHFITFEGPNRIPHLSITTKPDPNAADAKTKAAQTTNFKIRLTPHAYQNHRNSLNIFNAQKDKLDSLLAKNKGIIFNTAQKLKLEKDAKKIAEYQQVIKTAEQENEGFTKLLAIDDPIRIANSHAALFELLGEISNGIIEPELPLLAAHPYFHGKFEIVVQGLLPQAEGLLEHVERNKFSRLLLQNDVNAGISPCYMPDIQLKALRMRGQQENEDIYNASQSQSPSQRSASNLSAPEHDGTQDTCPLPDADVDAAEAKAAPSVPAASDKDEKQPTKHLAAAAAVAAAVPQSRIGIKRKRDDTPTPAPATGAPAAAAANAHNIAAAPAAAVQPNPERRLKRHNAGLRDALARMKSPLHAQPAAASAAGAGAGYTNNGVNAPTTAKLKRT